MQKFPFDIESLREWFLKNKRDLPWRHAPTPYDVWISEMMLQQTQVSVAIDYFLRWMKRFPTISSLAESSLETVLKMWEGLGYYSRARHVHAASRYFLEKHAGTLPAVREDLEKAPGLGPYTVGAILSFAFHQKAAAVDANVARVLARYFCIEEDISQSKTRKLLWEIAEQILPMVDPWVVVEGLIELGALVCTSKPKCTLCPLKKGCKAYLFEKEQIVPLKKKRKDTIFIKRNVMVIHYKEEWLLKQGIPGKLMGDLYEFPYFDDENAILAHPFPFSLVFETKLPEQSHSFTHYKAQLMPAIWEAEEKKDVTGYQWLSWDAIQLLPFSSGHKRILKDIARRRKQFE